MTITPYSTIEEFTEEVAKQLEMVLKEIADITRGKMVDTAQIQQVFEAINEIPEPEPRLRRLRLWSHPIWAGLIVVLLGMFWMGRKLAGTV